MGEHRAAPRIASRLIREKLSEPGLPQDRQTIRNWGEALIDLEYTAAREEIASKLVVQSDREILEYLQDLTSRLQLIEKNGDDVPAWSRLLTHEEPAFRNLARTRLARIGTDAARTALMSRFDELSPQEQAAVVIRLHLIPGPATTAILERVMTSTDFHGGRLESVRAAAAYAAGSIAGKEMIQLLRQASDKVRGRSFWYLLYLMRTGNEDAVSFIYSQHTLRLRSYHPVRWQETLVLEKIADDLRVGVRSPLLDLKPEEFQLQLR